MIYAFIMVCAAHLQCSTTNSDIIAKVRAPSVETCREAVQQIAPIILRAFPEDKIMFHCGAEDGA